MYVFFCFWRFCFSDVTSNMTTQATTNTITNMAAMKGFTWRVDDVDFCCTLKYCNACHTLYIHRTIKHTATKS